MPESHLVVAAANGERARSPTSRGKKPGDRSKKRLTVSLSDRTISHIKQLRDLSDADSDSEVVRNAVKLHLVLLKEHMDGKGLFLRDGGELTAIKLFDDVD